MGRDLSYTSFYTHSNLFQSTRPHGARLAKVEDKKARYKVSIHAPAWGATTASLNVTGIERVSIHAPAWGATICITWTGDTGKCFNPRARMGRDELQEVVISHLLAFQSTRPHGARHDKIVLSIIINPFQSTRPHGARQLQASYRCPSTMFQSTRPHGARQFDRCR